ncbi:MAG: hypothetical protein EOM25_09400 [Deltaproteobacteria bacterium]|nr:hypothetical protein [Deltaproteobacteria bacterium]
MKYDETIIRIFITSCLEQLSDIEADVLALERIETEGLSDQVNRIFRAVHTIKGDSGVLNLQTISSFAHKVEHALNLVRQHGVIPDQEYISALLLAFDTLGAMIKGVEGGEEPNIHGIEKRLEALDGMRQARKSMEESRGGLSGPASELVHVEPEAQDQKRSDDRVTRITVTAEQLDVLVQRIGELTMTHARLLREAKYSGQGTVRTLAEDIGILCQRLQEQTLEMRLIPVGIIFEKLRRLVRDLGAKLGKEVDLVVRGEGTGIDMAIIDHLNGPLVHIFRNCMDHGIEGPDERVQAGKPSRGRITVKAEQSGRDVRISIQDDGRGVDRQALLRKALERGVIKDSTLLDEDGLLDLVFLPGLSTKNGTDEVSGRGVGMDSVREAMETIRGSARVFSAMGQGTEILLEFPLSLAIVECLGVRVGETVFFVQLGDVVECLDLDAGARSMACKRRFIKHRGVALPVLDLASFYDMPSVDSGRHVVVVRIGPNLLMGLAVDEVVGQHPAVFQDISKVFSAVPGIHGTTVMDDGNLGIVLDVAGLSRSIEVRESRKHFEDAQ